MPLNPGWQPPAAQLAAADPFRVTATLPRRRLLPRSMPRPKNRRRPLPGCRGRTFRPFRHHGDGNAARQRRPGRPGGRRRPPSPTRTPPTPARRAARPHSSAQSPNPPASDTALAEARDQSSTARADLDTPRGPAGIARHHADNRYQPGPGSRADLPRRKRSLPLPTNLSLQTLRPGRRLRLPYPRHPCPGRNLARPRRYSNTARP